MITPEQFGARVAVSHEAWRVTANATHPIGTCIFVVPRSQLFHGRGTQVHFGASDAWPGEPLPGSDSELPSLSQKPAAYNGPGIARIRRLPLGVTAVVIGCVKRTEGTVHDGYESRNQFDGEPTWHEGWHHAQRTVDLLVVALETPGPPQLRYAWPEDVEALR